MPSFEGLRKAGTAISGSKTEYPRFDADQNSDIKLKSEDNLELVTTFKNVGSTLGAKKTWT